MKYTHETKKLPKSQVEIIVTVPSEELQPLITKAVTQLSQETKIEGFRPGKVPVEILKQKVGEMKILEEAAVLAVEKSYVEIITNEKLEPLGSPKIDFEKLAPANDFVYKATVTLIPEIKLGDIKSIKVKETEVIIKPEEIAQVISELQNARATEVLEDKIIAKGDKVEIDMDILRDNVPIENGAQKKYPMIIGEGKFIPGFEDNLIGLKAKDEKEFELTFPEKYHNNTLAGKPAKFKVKVLAVYKRTIPEINDEFAKTFGQESAAKLKEQIEHNLQHEAHHKEEEKVEIELLDKLIGICEFGEIPDLLITAEVNKMIQEMESNLAQQGFKFDDYLKHLNKTKDQLKLDFTPQAIKRVKGALMTRALFFQEKMEIPENEVDLELEQMTKMYQAQPEALKSIQTPEYRDYIRNIVGNRKIMDFIKTTCVDRSDFSKDHKC